MKLRRWMRHDDDVALAIRRLGYYWVWKAHNEVWMENLLDVKRPAEGKFAYFVMLRLHAFPQEEALWLLC